MELQGLHELMNCRLIQSHTGSGQSWHPRGLPPALCFKVSMIVNYMSGLSGPLKQHMEQHMHTSAPIVRAHSCSWLHIPNCKMYWGYIYTVLLHFMRCKLLIFKLGYHGAMGIRTWSFDSIVVCVRNRVTHYSFPFFLHFVLLPISHWVAVGLQAGGPPHKFTHATK